MRPIPVLKAGCLGVDRLASIILLPGPAATPDNHCQDEENGPSGAGTRCPTEVAYIEERSDDTRSHDLSEPVQEGIQGASAGVEVGDVDCVSLVCVEPVGRPEHGEQKDDIRFVLEGVPESPQLSFPGWVFHDDNAGSVAADDLVRVAQQESQASAEEHQDDESDVCSVGDSGGDFDVEVGAKRDLGIVY